MVKANKRVSYIHLFSPQDKLSCMHEDSVFLSILIEGKQGKEQVLAACFRSFLPFLP
jgi:hypothetical protein